MDYHLLVKFGDIVAPLGPSNLKELTIVQDMNSFLPEFRLRVQDTSGALTHVMPSDKSMSDIYVEVASTPSGKYKNSFSFSAFNRRPVGDQSNPSSMYDVSGLLNIPGMFSQTYSRAHSNTVKSSLESMALNELSVDFTDVSSSLGYRKTLLQPQWQNIQFLKWLKENLIGSHDEYGFKCFVKCEGTKKTFVFKSLFEMVNQPLSYKFIVNSTAVEDQLPVFHYSIFDYYKLYGSFASKKQRYGYFDYETSEFITGEEQAQDYLSLSDYWLIDQNDSEDSNMMMELGRSNGFTSDFGGRIKGSYSNRLMSLAKMWITTVGISDAVPGSVVQVLFPHGSNTGNLYSFQYSGYWLVERVVHNIGDSFMTKLLLTRNGLDTDKSTTLLRSAVKRGV